jgi:hypothetical protein
MWRSKEKDAPMAEIASKSLASSRTAAAAASVMTQSDFNGQSAVGA